MIELNDSNLESNTIKFDENSFSETSFDYKGNVDLSTMPLLKLRNGDIASTRGISYLDEQTNEFVLVPTVSRTGIVLDDETAIKMYKITGKHLGKFGTEDELQNYKKELNASQGEIEVVSEAQNAGDLAFSKDYDFRTLLGDNAFAKTVGWVGYATETLASIPFKIGEALGGTIASTTNEIQEKGLKGAWKDFNVEEAVVKPIERGLVSIEKSPFKLLDALGDGLHEMSRFNRNHKAWSKTLEVAGSLLKSANNVIEMADEWLDVSSTMKADPEWEKKVMSGSFTQNPSLQRLVSTTLESAPCLLLGMGMAKLTQNTIISALVMGNTDVIDEYYSAREKGKTAYEALGVYTAQLIGTSALEKYGLDEIVFTKKVAERAAKRIMKAGVAEMGTEMGQQMYQNAVARIGYDADREIMQGVIEAGLSALILGSTGKAIAGDGFIDPIVSTVQQYYKVGKDKAIDIINNVYLPRMKEMGNVINEEVLNNGQKFVQSVEQDIKQMESMGVDLTNVKKEISRNTEEYFGELLEAMPEATEETLNAGAELLSAMTYRYGLINNMTPAEAKKKAPKFIKAKFDDFIKNIEKTSKEKSSIDDIPFQTDDKALEMKKQGKTAKEIFNETKSIEVDEGVFVSLEDFVGVQADLSDEAESKKKLKDILFGKIVDKNDFIKNIDVSLVRDNENPYRFAAISDDGKEIIINLNVLEKYRNELSSVLSHEFMHGIQIENNYWQGASSEELIKLKKETGDKYYNHIKNIINKSFNTNLSIEETTELYENSDKALEILKNNKISEKSFEDFINSNKYKKAIKEIPNEIKKAYDYTKDDYGVYLQHHGEIVARAVEKISKMTKEEYENSSYEDIFDIDLDKSLKLKKGESFREYLRKKGIQLQGKKGAYINGNIYLFENADITTVVHEFGHFWSKSLAQMNTPMAKRILTETNKWADKEFDRKYSLVKKGNKYIVSNKDGSKKIYDNLGKGFETEEKARNYAKEEIFAQGLEQYTMGEISPNNYVKKAFNDFMNYAKEVYNENNALGIEFTPEMKQLYANMLGGASIDTFLNGSAEEFIKEKQEAKKEIAEQINDIIQDGEEQAQFQTAFTSDTIIDEAELMKKVKDRNVINLQQKLFTPISRIAYRISPKLQARLRRFYYDKKSVANKYRKQIMPFLTAVEDIKKKNKEDYARLKLAMENCSSEHDTTSIIEEILTKYDAFNTIFAVDEMLDKIYEDAKKLGIDIDYKSKYYPRWVKDYEGFNKYTQKAMYSPLENALRKLEAETGTRMSAQERAAFFNDNLNRLHNTESTIKGRANPRAKRKVDLITAEMDKFYGDISDTFLHYIDGMVNYMETNKFLKVMDGIDEKSIGEYLQELIDGGFIKKEDVDMAFDVILHTLDDLPVKSKYGKVARDLGYIATMSQFSTTITQIDDFSSTWLNVGIIKGIQALFIKNQVSIEDVSLDSIGDEFRTVEGLSKAVQNLFKYTGLTKFDKFQAETFLDAEKVRLSETSIEDIANEIQYLFDSYEETMQVAKDLKNGVKNENTMFYYFNKMSDYRPTSRLEMPTYYKGDSRVFYMLKSFMIKRLDMWMQRIDALLNSKNKSERIKATKELVRLFVILMLCGMGKDELIDLLYGRKTTLSERVEDNLYGLFGINKYFAWQARENGAAKAIQSFVFNIPIGNVIDTFQKDVSLFLEDKRELKNFDTLKYVPFVGGLYYWYLGRGLQKKEKEEKDKSNKEYKEMYGKRKGNKKSVI